MIQNKNLFSGVLMLLSELLRGSGAVIPENDIEIESVTSCSGRVVPRGVFVALKGERTDGNLFVGEARAKGAAAIVTDDGSVPGAIYVPDADAASAVIFSNYYGRPCDGARTVAVTGTCGKTTTVSMISHILRECGRRVGTLGTVELRAGGRIINKEEFYPASSASMTTPDVENFYRALGAIRDEGCDTVVMEASSHSLERKRFSGMKVDLGLFTNLSPEHLDHHADMESYFAAKRNLADISSVFITNTDDPYGYRLFTEYPGSLGIGSYDRHDPARLFASYRNVTDGGDGVSYDLVYDGESVRLSTPLWGDFGLYNTHAAVSAALALGVPAEKAAGAVRSFGGVPGRMEIPETPEGAPTVIIDYAHTPASLEAVLKNVRRHFGRRIILVFGCGGERDRTKRSVMGRAARDFADYTIVTSDNPRGEDPEAIISDIVEGFSGSGGYETVPDRADALRRAVEISRPSDVILCCGKGHEKYIIDSSGKHFFDEAAILLEAVGNVYGENRDLTEQSPDSLDLSNGE